jgi:CRP/FNR family transcriptional regulator
VAEALLEMREKFDTDVDGYIRVAVTRRDIAYYTGTTYETVFRTLAAWEAGGIIRTVGKSICVAKPEMLNASGS